MKQKTIKKLYKEIGKAHVDVITLQIEKAQLEEKLFNISGELELAIVTYEEGISLINEIMVEQLGGRE